MSDTLYYLQHKYHGRDLTWEQAMNELSLPPSYRRGFLREQFKAALGMYQLRKSTRATWFVCTKKLATYIDQQKRKRI